MCHLPVDDGRRLATACTVLLPFVLWARRLRAGVHPAQVHTEGLTPLDCAALLKSCEVGSQALSYANSGVEQLLTEKILAAPQALGKK